jgi:hypothetical protein
MAGCFLLALAGMALGAGRAAAQRPFDFSDAYYRAGAIAPDAFLETVHKLDGTPLVPELVTQFSCLQSTGSFCFGR